MCVWPEPTAKSSGNGTQKPPASCVGGQSTDTPPPLPGAATPMHWMAAMRRKVPGARCGPARATPPQCVAACCVAAQPAGSLEPRTRLMSVAGWVFTPAHVHIGAAGWSRHGGTPSLPARAGTPFLPCVWTPAASTPLPLIVLTTLATLATQPPPVPWVDALCKQGAWDRHSHHLCSVEYSMLIRVCVP